MSLTYQHGLQDGKTALGAAAVWKARQQPSPSPIDQQKIS
jgi:hypothetical protein